MKSILSRVHIHNHKEPNGRAYIIGDKKGLLALAETIEQAARGALGMEVLKLFSSDGHGYEVMIVADVSEEEWQVMPTPYDKSANPAKLKSVEDYDSVRKELEPKPI